MDSGVQTDSEILTDSEVLTDIVAKYWVFIYEPHYDLLLFCLTK